MAPYPSFPIQPGVLSDVLTYVLTHASDLAVKMEEKHGQTQEPKEKAVVGKTAVQTHPKEAVFVRCFQFLRAMAVKNPEVQRR